MPGGSKGENKCSSKGGTNMFGTEKVPFLLPEPFFTSWVKFHFLREAFLEPTEEDGLLISTFMELYTFLS